MRKLAVLSIAALLYAALCAGEEAQRPRILGVAHMAKRPRILGVAHMAKRPRILGVAHMALYVSDLEKARAFYEDFLGFAEPFSLKGKDGAERIAFIKINDYQYIELFAEAPKNDGQLNHISFYTDDAKALRGYLASRGITVPEKVGKGQTGNSNYNITDPGGHTVEIVQYEPDSWTAREKGKFMPGSRISTHIAHVGVLIRELEPAVKFYRDIFGFQEAGGDKMRVPDGDDSIELGLNRKPPTPDRYGIKNHICLVAPDVPKAVAILEGRPNRKNYGPIEVHQTTTGKRAANLYDPDGTRIELMEPNTIDGKPALQRP